MNALLRPAVAVLVVALLVVCAFGLRCASDPAGPAGLRDVAREARRDEDLRRLNRATLRREEARQQVVRELLAGRLGLAEALAAFGELDREWPDYATPRAEETRSIWPRDEDRRYERIAAIARDLLRERPEELAAVLHRLDEEYRPLRAGGAGPLTPDRTRKP
jgi:hypothetical protein